MENLNKPSGAAVDEILEELKGNGGPLPKADDSELDAILAELGIGDKLPVVPKKLESQSAKPASVAPVSQAPSASGGTATFSTVKPPAQPRGGAKQETMVFSPAKEQPAEKGGRDDESEKPRKADRKKDAAQAAIWDIEPEHGPAQPRVGKAAALDKVDREKFSGDTELLSWFSDYAPIPSKKEQKEARKEEKRQRNAERKTQKQRGKEDDGEYMEILSPEDMQEVAEAAPVWHAPKEDEVVTGSAFEQGAEEDWPTESSLFDTGSFTEIKQDTGRSGLSDTAAFPPPAAGKGPVETNFFDTATMPEVHAGAKADVAATAVFAAGAAGKGAPGKAPENLERRNTQSYELEEEAEAARVPTAAFTQEFDTAGEDADVPSPTADTAKTLYLDDMVDDRFRQFFSETVIVEREEEEMSPRARRKRKRSRTALITGEFAKLAEQAAEEAAEDEFEDYNRPQDAGAIEKDLATLKKNLTRRVVCTGIVGALLLWLGLAYSNLLPAPEFLAPAAHPLMFSAAYLVLLLLGIVVNFTTIATGLIGLVGEATVDTPPALASVAALLQAVVLLVQAVTAGSAAPLADAAAAAEPVVAATLFGGVAALVLAANALGKRIRARSILDNFQLASGGFDHSAAYVLDGSHELAYNITRGLDEDNPTLLISRPTALVKGFLRQSFSQHWSDKIGRILGWVLLGVALLCGGVTFVHGNELMPTITALAAVLCIGAPLSSTLVSAIPNALLQQSSSKIGAVVPGWSAIEELGTVNVVMAGARDIFPPSSVQLRGIKTFEKERIDLAILYAASVLIEGCETMRDIFLGVIQGKADMLYKVESLVTETGRGFTAWVENSRVVIGTREMLQKHDIDPPPIEVEMKYVKDGNLPVYLAVSGKLFAMFVVGYKPDPEVEETLDGLVKSGVSLLVTSNDMNVTNELIERVYNLSPGVVKVLGRRELDMLGPLTEYMPESVGVMSHIGSFTSFIGGMRAAAGCAVAERMSGIVQIASVALAGLLSLVLVFSGGLANLSVTIALLYQLGWTVLISALPFVRRY